VIDESRGIGTRIAEVRRLKGLSQVQLAEELGISKPGLANYERGFRVPPASLVADLCEKHAVSAGWLLLGDGAIFTPDLGQVHERALATAWAYLTRGGDEVQQEHLVRLSAALFQYILAHEQCDEGVVDAMGKLVA
jgi:transcriptional regulator with XRE-family HTH domain